MRPLKENQFNLIYFNPIYQKLGGSKKHVSLYNSLIIILGFQQIIVIPVQKKNNL
jgi:hypothetical protein